MTLYTYQINPNFYKLRPLCAVVGEKTHRADVMLFSSKPRAVTLHPQLDYFHP